MVHYNEYSISGRLISAERLNIEWDLGRLLEIIVCHGVFMSEMQYFYCGSACNQQQSDVSPQIVSPPDNGSGHHSGSIDIHIFSSGVGR
jgi:hypothetical protein